MFFQPVENNLGFWTDRLNKIADATGLHSILVMASLPTTMKVVVANQQPIYHANDEGPKSVQAGCHELYCERVVNTKQTLLVSDASADPEWAGNEDLVQFGLGTYLGLPLMAGDVVLGTVCALNKEEYDFEAGIPTAHQRLLDLKMELEAEIVQAIHAA